ncbi:MAG: sulfite exporter TauE/SafE family protein [Thermodesulfobacteriota bacterium]
MSFQMFVLLFFIFLTASAVFSMFGQGGGAFYVPMLLALSVPMYVAATTSQILIMVVSFSSMLVFAKARTVDWKLVLLIEPPTNIGAFLGGYLSPFFPADLAKLCFAGVLLIGAYYLYRPPGAGAEARANSNHWWLWHRDAVVTPYTINVLFLVPIMLLAGFVAGMLGVGGGLLKVPAVVALGGVPMSIAVGSSSLMIGVTALTGFVGHLLRGHFDLRLTAVLAAAVLIGSQIGPRFAVKTNQARLKQYFAVLLLAIATWLLYGVMW